MLWFQEEVRPGVWVGFTDSTAGNLAFHVGDDPGVVAGNRERLDAQLTALTGGPVRLQYMN